MGETVPTTPEPEPPEPEPEPATPVPPPPARPVASDRELAARWAEQMNVG